MRTNPLDINTDFFSWDTSTASVPDLMATYSKGKQFNNKNNKPSPKIIYAEDDIYAGKTENGFYLFHTTLDPAETYKQRRIGLLSEKPEKKFIVETIKYGQMGDKVKWLLDKSKLQEWIEDEYGFTFSEKPSPWAPKKLGAAKRENPETTSISNSDSDNDTEKDEPQKKIQKTEPIPDFTIIINKIDELHVLLSELVTHKRNEESNSDVSIIDNRS